MKCNFSVKAAAIVFVIFEIVVVALAAASCGVAQLTVKKDITDYYAVTSSKVRMDGSACFTFWGYKADCGETGHTYVGNAAYGCPQRRDMMLAAGAFAIAAGVFAAAAAVIGALMLAHIRCLALIPMSLVAFSAALLIVAWVYVLQVYQQETSLCKTRYYANKEGDDIALAPERLMTAFKHFTNFGPGFPMLVIGCGLQMVSLLLLILMVTC